MATKSKLKKSRTKLSKEHRDSLLKQINKYANTLSKASKWANSKDSIGYVKNRDDDKDKKGVNYIYEFYCYIRIACDLLHNYKVVYKEGEGNKKDKFPQAASLKKGKPKFLCYDASGKNLIFQYCAGVKIKGKYNSENDHPDISFQTPLTGDNPGLDDLIMIFDAKFQIDNTSNLDKGEPDKFETIVRRFKLNSDKLKVDVHFHELKKFNGNCLLTNALFHCAEGKDLENRLKDEFIKEVQEFYPQKQFKIIPN